tara:strand:- start:7656 stop:10013 length:2358 start_codon:yes stop_codon:yes gene_type:complete
MIENKGPADPFDLAAAAPCGLVRVGPDGVIQAANARFLHWIGEAEADVIGHRRFIDLLPGGARVFFEMHLLPRLRLGGELEETAFQINRPGIGRWDVLLTACAQYRNGPTVLALIPADSRRRFERIQSERRHAAESEVNWLRQIEAMGNLGAWSLTVETQTLHWSPKVFELYDLPAGEAPSLVDAATYLATDEMRRDWLLNMMRCGADGDAFAMEVKINSAEGHRRILLIKGEPDWQHGRIVRVIGIVQDLTVQRRAEAERDLRKARIMQLNANLPGVFMSYEIDTGGAFRITYVSPRCDALWGCRRADLYRDPNRLDHLGEDNIPTGIVETLRGTTERKLTGRFRVALQKNDVRWFDLRGSVVRQGADTAEGSCVFLDVTREVEAEIELATMAAIAQQAQKNETIGKLTGGLAHDFNNLLAVIMGNLELLQEDLSPAEERNCIAQALEAVERGAGLTRSMLAFARRARLDPTMFDLGEMAQQTLTWARRTLPASISLHVEATADLPQVKADFDMATSALLNLVINARDAMPQGGNLRIEVEARHVGQDDAGVAMDGLTPGDYVVASVIDTGEGISEGALSRIFEPFFTTKPPGSGSGLGLSMVYGFMKQSNGAVRVRSKAGEGSVFELYFPVVSDTPPTPGNAQPAQADPVSGERYRILIVEDEAAVLTTLTRILEASGYRTTGARSGDEAALLFSQDRAFDLVLTDVVMPGTLQGYALVRELRGIRPDLPVILMSGHASASVPGADELDTDELCLAKPIRRQELLGAVTRVLADRRSEASDGP